MDSSSHNLSEQGDMNLERFFHQIFTFISIHVTGIFISDIWSIFIVKYRYKYPVPCNRHGEVYLTCMKVMEPWCREVIGWENNGWLYGGNTSRLPGTVALWKPWASIVAMRMFMEIFTPHLPKKIKTYWKKQDGNIFQIFSKQNSEKKAGVSLYIYWFICSWHVPKKNSLVCNTPTACMNEKKHLDLEAFLATSKKEKDSIWPPDKKCYNNNPL